MDEGVLTRRESGAGEGRRRKPASTCEERSTKGAISAHGGAFPINHLGSSGSAMLKNARAVRLSPCLLDAPGAFDEAFTPACS